MMSDPVYCEKCRMITLSTTGHYCSSCISPLIELARIAKKVAVRLELIQEAGPFGQSPKWTQDLLDALKEADHFLED